MNIHDYAKMTEPTHSSNLLPTPSAFNPGSFPVPTPQQVRDRLHRLESEDKSGKRSYSRAEAARSGERLYQAQLKKE